MLNKWLIRIVCLGIIVWALNTLFCNHYNSVSHQTPEEVRKTLECIDSGASVEYCSATNSLAPQAIATVFDLF